ncbi:MAG: L-threonylcarbamoyladenylate synthase [Candidatus Bipolaricaulia bacterium]
MKAKALKIRDRLSSAEAALIAEVVSRGGLFVFPTETVYGLGCAADDQAALERLYRLKGRERAKPMALHLGGVEELFRYAIVGERERKWIEKLLPGPYTLILRASPEAPKAAVSAGKVGIRVPASRAFGLIAQAAERPLVGTSANRSGEPPVTSSEEALAQFSDKVELIILTDEPLSGRSSTVLDLTEEPPKALRGELPKS